MIFSDEGFSTDGCFVDYLCSETDRLRLINYFKLFKPLQLQINATLRPKVHMFVCQFEALILQWMEAGPLSWR